MSPWLPVYTQEYYPRSLRSRACKVSRTAVILVAVALAAIISLHSLLRHSSTEYAQITSPSNITNYFHWPAHETTIVDVPTHETWVNGTKRANAVLLMLVRNSEQETAMNSIKELENRFNKRYGYPWVLLNEVPFTQEFKERISSVVAGPVTFGRIPHEHWYQPDWIDEEAATASREKMAADGVIYGGSLSYRSMCRFNSGFFYKHPLMQPYKWYWRVEPNVHFHCDLDYDPFLFMEQNNKVYEFMHENPQYLHKNNALEFISDDKGESYNTCHFWSNFEIANMDFWRGEAYSKFFDHLESKGGFYYERWGDAPVHSIGAALFARKDQIHWFKDIGYEHEPFQHCPLDADVYKAQNCDCNPPSSFRRGARERRSGSALSLL
ncbi:Glycolipid 2-alpha-mannosyltransferase 2 [Trametes pubescens]|uniref:Glycolipid 2-alpha-mannosyltransferase 2 n=1 Tax=Trametes pubescens TaxID=154538 RepID=A0A1M2VDS3_TRAPU|nr:Glycolipid 2-alpha-mannosyltransferase 2 [Trametes pubescens]